MKWGIGSSSCGPDHPSSTPTAISPTSARVNASARSSFALGSARDSVAPAPSRQPHRAQHSRDRLRRRDRRRHPPRGVAVRAHRHFDLEHAPQQVPARRDTRKVPARTRHRRQQPFDQHLGCHHQVRRAVLPPPFQLIRNPPIRQQRQPRRRNRWTTRTSLSPARLPNTVRPTRPALSKDRSTGGLDPTRDCGCGLLFDASGRERFASLRVADVHLEHGVVEGERVVAVWPRIHE